jgi:hypothetical protein
MCCAVLCCIGLQDGHKQDALDLISGAFKVGSICKQQQQQTWALTVYAVPIVP